MASVLVFDCGCTVGRSDVGTTSIGVCDEHRSEFALVLEELAMRIMAKRLPQGEPMVIDSTKMAATLERALALEVAEEGPVDGSA